MGLVLDCLAKKPPPNNGEHFAGGEELFQPQRRERQRIGNVVEMFVRRPSRKFEPTPEMVELLLKLDKSRATAMAALAKLLARKASHPDITALRNFRRLAGDVAYLERACENAEHQAREQFEAEEKKRNEKLFQHKEAAHQPMLVNLFALADGLEELRAKGRAETEATKAETRRERELRRQAWRHSWLDQVVENVKAEANTAYAEDELSDDELQRVHEIAGELSEAMSLAAAASTAYAEDLIPEEAFHFYRSMGL